ncbi:MAG: RrF2 family transcriptional regulator [Christensenellales bacterium]|jgi:Rrf2 family cysteine metabolism transcriptional repressor
MRLSTKGRYGLRAMYVLAQNYGEGPVALSTVAAREDISMAYLEQLMASLRKAELVTSMRGAQGGYELIRPPDTITVGEVLRALEGEFALCEDDRGHCEKSDICASRVVFDKMRHGINQVMDSINLSDMLSEMGESQ